MDVTVVVLVLSLPVSTILEAPVIVLETSVEPEDPVKLEALVETVASVVRLLEVVVFVVVLVLGLEDVLVVIFEVPVEHDVSSSSLLSQSQNQSTK